MTNYLHGDFQRARALAEEALTLGTDLGDIGYLTAVRCCLAWFASLEGHPPDTDQISGGDPRGVEVMRSSAMRATVAGAAGAAAYLKGRPNEAITALEALLDPRSASYNPTFAVITSHDFVDAALAVGDTASAQRRKSQLADLHDIWPSPIVVAANRYAGLALAADNDLDSVAHDLDTNPLPIPYMHARALLRLGDRLRRNKRTAESRSALRAALAAFTKLPAPAWAARTTESLRATGERMPDTVPSGVHVLTPQELRICTLAASGLTNREIAEALFLSPRTVGAHLYSAYQKLGISSREQLDFLR